MQAFHPSHGTACLVLAKHKAFFPQVHQIFFEHCTEYTLPPYLSAESVVTALEEMGAMSVIRELPCTHTISIREDRLLEQYLQQSVMDTMPLPKWRQHSRLRDFLDAYRHGDASRSHTPIGSSLACLLPGERLGNTACKNYLTSVTYSRQPR